MFHKIFLYNPQYTDLIQILSLKPVDPPLTASEERQCNLDDVILT